MRKIYFLLLATLTVISFIIIPANGIARTKTDINSSDFPDSTAIVPSIHLLTPNGGEQFIGFSLILIQWTGTNLSITHTPKIEVSTNGGNTWTEDYLWYVISMSDLGGSAYYLLPSTLSSQVKLRLSEYYHPEIYDVSDNDFSITSNQQLLVIVDGLNFQKITSNSIIDFVFYTNESFDEDYFTVSVTFDGGVQWEIVEEHVRIGVNVPGPCFWEIPENTFGTCQVKFQSESVPERNGKSVLFTIHKVPEIEISANYPQNLIHTDTTFVIDYKKIDEYYLYDIYFLYLSKDKGITWEYLKNLTLEANSGNFQIKAPTQETDSCLFRVVDGINGNSSDITDYISFRNFPFTPICVVTTDPSTKKNLIKWSKPESQYIHDYIVYRETDVTDDFEELGRISKNNPGEFVDLTSNPGQQAYRYCLGYADQQNRLYPLSDPHQTIHLSVYKSPENHFNLIWNPYFGATIETYTIYRGSTEASLTEIATLASTNISYTDDYSTAGTVVYKIKANSTGDCSTAGDFSIYSNIVNESSLGIFEEQSIHPITVYPNPANEKICLNISSIESNLNYSIADITGKVLISQTLKIPATQPVEINVADLANGMYLLQLKTRQFTTIKKIVISH